MAKPMIYDITATGSTEARDIRDQFTDAVEKKGKDARIHFGVIAQQVAEAFASEGLDASRYALFCYDKWDDEYEDVKVVDAEAVLDEYGNEVTPAKTHTEKRLVTLQAIDTAYATLRRSRLNVPTSVGASLNSKKRWLASPSLQILWGRRWARPLTI